MNTSRLVRETITVQSRAKHVLSQTYLIALTLILIIAAMHQIITGSAVTGVPYIMAALAVERWTYWRNRARTAAMLTRLALHTESRKPN